MRQVDAPARHRRAAVAGERRSTARWRPDRGTGSAHRTRLPGTSAPAVAVGRGQHHLPARARRLARLAARDAPRGAHRDGRSRPRGHGCASVRALGRDAPASRAGPRARARTRGPPARRALQRARCTDPRAVRSRAPSTVGPSRPDDRARHPQHRGGDPRRRPGGRDVPAPGPRRRRYRGRPATAANHRGPRRRGGIADRTRDPVISRRCDGDGPPRGRVVTRTWWFPIVAGFAVFVLAWKLVVVIGDLPPFILPAPETVAGRFVGAWLDGTVWPHFQTTMVEILSGFVVGSVLALLVGYGLARSDLFERLASPYLVAAQAIPILVLAPLFVLWFGSGLVSKVVICALIVFFPVAIATMVGIRSVDARLIELGRSLRATRRQILTTLEIPAALPSIFGGLRVGVTLAVVGAIVGEWAGASKGLAVLINLARGSLFDIPLMFATLLTIALVGVALYLIVVGVERRLIGVR